MSITEYPVNTLHGEASSLGDYLGKALLVVNVASKCGLTPQYEGLEKLHEQYADRGFAVVGFPCNQFGGQEPGTEAQIAEFCEATYKVKFPMFSKIVVKGEGIAPLYQFLTAETTNPGNAGDIKWNFEKFLIGRDGKVIARYSPNVSPEAPEVVAAIEKELAKK